MATSLTKEQNLTQLDRNTGDGRAKLRSWLGKVFKVVITDGRQIVGVFVCTDRDANIILENSMEYGKPIGGNNEPRALGVALIPGKHIVSVALMN